MAFDLLLCGPCLLCKSSLADCSNSCLESYSRHPAHTNNSSSGRAWYINRRLLWIMQHTDWCIFKIVRWAQSSLWDPLPVSMINPRSITLALSRLHRCSCTVWSLKALKEVPILSHVVVSLLVTTSLLSMTIHSSRFWRESVDFIPERHYGIWG